MSLEIMTAIYIYIHFFGSFILGMFFLFFIILWTYFIFSFKIVRYSFENGKIVSNSCMQTEIVLIYLHSVIGQYFTICCRLLESLLKWFSQVVDTILKMFNALFTNDVSIH
jgi:hypothetical protein